MTNSVQSTQLAQKLAEIDDRLLAALGERIALQRSSADFPTIWEQSLNQRAKNWTGTSSDEALTWLMHTASLCARQSTKREPIVYLGPLYSYSYLAAVSHFGLAAEFVPVTTIAAAFDEISRGQAAFAVVPIENNTDGGVVDTLGRFARSPAQICGEVLLPVHHCLLGRCSRAEVREVHSKPQALSQCRNWLEQHLPNAKLVEVASTAAAAVLAAETPGVAAIASREAGIHHGCNVIDENIEDNQHNITRFAIIGSRVCKPTGADKTTLMFQLKHEPGALASAMLIFKEFDVNLTWIESFPLPDRPNEYLFFIELDGHSDNAPIAATIEELRRKTQQIDVLGSYPRG
jgi:chorismate mutase / prephenate dehydratase